MRLLPIRKVSLKLRINTFMFKPIAPLAFSVIALSPIMLFGQPSPQHGEPPGYVPGQPIKPTPEQQQLLAKAREILKKTTLPLGEQEVRLRILDAALAGTVITPDDENPQVRNPKYWTTSKGSFVPAPGCTACEAISDLWIVHDNDGVPVPRIWCYKYSVLIVAKGYIQYFRDTGNRAGLAALDDLIGHGNFPNDLPGDSDRLLWTKRLGSDRLLPGDQVWFENPYFERGQEYIRQEAFREATAAGKSAEEAAAAAKDTAIANSAGEEGSNIFYLGDERFVRGARSVERVFRGSFHRDSANDHDQVYTPKVFTFKRYQQHMINDNYTVQATLRANPGGVRPEDFQIRRVRSPVDPSNLLRYAASKDPAVALDLLIEAMASRNKPPKLVEKGGKTVPLFDNDYDWPEQERVRSAIQTVLHVKTDAMWWRLREYMGDKRYVLTARHGRVAENFTFGSFCCDMVTANLCVAYANHLPAVPGKLPDSFRPEDEYWKNEKQWLRARKPLYAMQAALCQRALEQWENVSGTLPGRDGRSHLFSPEEKARFVAALKKEIEDRNGSKVATFQEVLLPWVIAPSGWEGFDAESAKEVVEE
jgi:hypothetical protein